MEKIKTEQEIDQALHDYMVFWSNEWVEPPAFYWVADVSGESPKHALESNLEKIIQAAREFDGSLSDLDRDYIVENLCLLRRDCWTSQYTPNWSEIFV